MKKLYIVFLALICLLFSGCVAEEETGESAHWIYYVNYKQGSLERMEYKLDEGVEKLELEHVVEWLSSKNDAGISLLPSGVELIGYSLADNVLKLNFNSNYRKIVFTDEILFRAAIVKNFVQAQGIHFVQFFVEEEELQDTQGNPVGIMRGSSFVEFSGENLGDIQSKKLLLYFANETGDKLLSETRTVYYTSSAPIEKVIVEQLIQGPQKSKHFATLPSNTGIISVSIANGVAYVNLDQKVTGEEVAVMGDVSIYSIVNSVLSAGNASKVQISINGDSKVVFKETVNLAQSFEFNFKILEGADENSQVIPQLTSEVDDE